MFTLLGAQSSCKKRDGTQTRIAMHHDSNGGGMGELQTRETASWVTCCTSSFRHSKQSQQMSWRRAMRGGLCSARATARRQQQDTSQVQHSPLSPHPILDPEIRVSYHPLPVSWHVFSSRKITWVLPRGSPERCPDGSEVQRSTAAHGLARFARW